MISPDETFDDRVLLKGNRLDMIGNPKGSTLQIKYSLNSNDVFQWKCAWESKLSTCLKEAHSRKASLAIWEKKRERLYPTVKN